MLKVPEYLSETSLRVVTGLTYLAVHTPRRFPQPAPSSYRWSGEGSAAGRSRRDAKRPSGDRGSWHADRVGAAS